MSYNLRLLFFRSSISSVKAISLGKKVRAQVETVKIRSTITPALLGLTLRRGGILGAAGALLIFFGGTFLALTQLKTWGIPLFFIGISFIGVGLFPYRQLSRLQLKPNELYDMGESFFFHKEGKPLFKIPKKSIAKMRHLEKEHHYGIAIWLRRPIEEKVGILQSHFRFENFVSDSAQKFEGCDLFLPYFTKNAWESLKDQLE